MHREIEDLERRLDDARRDAEEARAAEAASREILAVQTAALETLLSQEARDLRHRRSALIVGDLLLGASEEPPAVARLRQTLLRDGSLQGRDLSGWTRRLEAASDAVKLLGFRLDDELTGIKREAESLQEERAELEGGRSDIPMGSRRSSTFSAPG